MQDQVAKSYAKQYKKHYTNILYFEYTGDLHQSVTDMDFSDDLPEDTEEERFRKHNCFLRSLKDGNCLGAHYSNINSGFPINAFFIASTAFFPCFLAVPI